MATSRIIKANLIMLAAILPGILVFNESGSMRLNVVGLCYIVLLVLFGGRVAPKVVNDYVDFMNETHEPSDELI